MNNKSNANSHMVHFENQCKAASEVLADCQIVVSLDWKGPCKSLRELPDRCASVMNSKGVYAWMVGSEAEPTLARIGAARDLLKRLRKYDSDGVFTRVHEVAVYVAEVPPDFQEKFKLLIEYLYPDFAEMGDSEFPEYRLERLLLDKYRVHFNALPPGNFSSGSVRPYLRHMTLVEGEPTIDLAPTLRRPAELNNEERELFRQSKAKKPPTKPTPHQPP